MQKTNQNAANRRMGATTSETLIALALTVVSLATPLLVYLPEGFFGAQLALALLRRGLTILLLPVYFILSMVYYPSLTWAPFLFGWAAAFGVPLLPPDETIRRCTV